MANNLPLENVKICDFMWVMAGPASTRILADYGATVVRIESPTRIDTARTLQPYLDNKLGPDSSGLFANCNAGKFGISLDLANPAARSLPDRHYGEKNDNHAQRAVRLSPCSRDLP